MYEVEGDYFVDRLNRMWVQEQPPPSVEVVGGDHWARFRGIISEGSKFRICYNGRDLCHILRTMHHLQESVMQLLLFCSLQADPPLVAIT
jgi:hypothetical protein